MDLKQKSSISSTLGPAPSYSEAEHGSEICPPLQRWELENFREQPWHGIAREVVVYALPRDCIFSHQGMMEADVSHLSNSDCERDTKNVHIAGRSDKIPSGKS